MTACLHAVDTAMGISYVGNNTVTFIAPMA
jgi:hypothetical protein